MKNKKLALIIAIGIIGLLFLTMSVILGYTPLKTTPWPNAFIGIATSFIAGAIITYLLHIAGMDSIKEQSQELFDYIGERMEMDCVSRVKLINSCNNLGLVEIYPDRNSALRESRIIESINKEKDKIFITGSSLLGIFESKESKEFFKALKFAMEGGAKTVIVLTHPLYSDLRADQEIKPRGEIGKEIIESLEKIKHEFRAFENKYEIYLYRGTPTMFGIKTTEIMIINPYPYGWKASLSPCYLFRKNSISSEGYNFYRDKHFHTNFGIKIEKIVLGDKVLEFLKTNFDKCGRSADDFDDMFPKIKDE